MNLITLAAEGHLANPAKFEKALQSFKNQLAEDPNAYGGLKYMAERFLIVGLIKADEYSDITNILGHDQDEYLRHADHVVAAIPMVISQFVKEFKARGHDITEIM